MENNKRPLNTILGGLFIIENHMGAMQGNNEKWKQEITQKWHESKKLPRKKKKAVRKGLLLDWQIANWEPKYDF